MAYADLAAELAGTIPGLSPILAATYIRRAWRDIRNRKNWAFKTAQATLSLPAAITAGTAAIVQGSTSVTFSATALTALTSYLTGALTLTSLQVRFNNGPLYRILALNPVYPPLVVTLDRPVTEATNAVSPYSVYRAYITPPVPDFSRWDSFEDLAGNRIIGRRLSYSSVDFDRRDSQRTSFGIPSLLGAFMADAAGLPLYELWPHANTAQTWTVTFRRTGVDFTLPGDTQPILIPDSLIMSRALGWYGYVWAQANRSRVPDLAKVDFTALLQAERQSFEAELQTITVQDEDLALSRVYNRGRWGGGRDRRDTGPVGDASYWQSHPINW